MINVEATTDAIDYRQLEPALDRCKTRLGHLPKQIVAEAGLYACRRTPFVSVCRSCAYRDQCATKKAPASWRRKITRIEEPAATIAFKARMMTEEAKRIYKQRSQIAEFPHAWIKQRCGLRQFRCRDDGRRRWKRHGRVSVTTSHAGFAYGASSMLLQRLRNEAIAPSAPGSRLTIRCTRSICQ